MLAWIRIAFVAFALAVPAAASAQGSTPAPALVAPLSNIAWVIGSTWHARLPPDAGAVEVSYDAVPDNPYAIRFVTRFLGGRGRVTNTYVGLMYYDLASKRAMIWYVDGKGEISQGPMTIDGNSWKISLRGPGEPLGLSGEVAETVEVVRTTPDRYEWTLYAGNDMPQKKIFGLTYARNGTP